MNRSIICISNSCSCTRRSCRRLLARRWSKTGRASSRPGVVGDLFPMAILGPYAAASQSLVRVGLELFRRRVLGGAALPALPLPDIARDATALGERLVVAMRAKLVVPELRALAAPPPAA